MVPLPYGSITWWFHLLFFFQILPSPGWSWMGIDRFRVCTSTILEFPYTTNCAQKHGQEQRHQLYWLYWSSDPSFRCASWLRHSKIEQFHQWTEAPRFLRSWDGKAALAGNECAGVGSFCTTMFGILTTSCKTCFSTNVSTEYLPITVRPLQDHGIMQDQCH